MRVEATLSAESPRCTCPHSIFLVDNLVYCSYNFWLLVIFGMHKFVLGFVPNVDFDCMNSFPVAIDIEPSSKLTNFNKSR